MNGNSSHFSTMSRFPLAYISLVCLLFWGIFGFIHAQDYEFCINNRSNGIAWSPDGEQLAVMTTQGVQIYDPNLELIKSIPAPLRDFSSIGSSPVWSPDGTWILLPNRVPLEYLNYAGGAGTASIANVVTEEVIGIAPLEGAVEIIWSPDNRFILSLYYESQFGINLPYSEIRVSRAAVEGTLPPRTSTVRFDGIHLSHLHWSVPDVFTARLDGIILTFNSTSLAHVDAAPTFYPDWWVSNNDGTREAAYKPDLFFYVRDIGQDEQVVAISPSEYLDGKSIIIGEVERIQWLLDNRRLIGIYPFYFRLQGEYPELLRILQGTVVDAQTASEINHFMIYAESNIQAYSVSNQGDRIAILRDSSWVELWNPLTNEHLTSIEIPPIAFGDICD